MTKKVKNILLGTIIGAILIVGFHGSSAIAQTIPWQEDFSTSDLDPSWQVMPGLGSYSLTDNLGHLRYYLQGPRAHDRGWDNPNIHPGWYPSLTLLRPFEGDTWILRAKVTYNIRWYGAGAQYQMFWIAFGEGTNDYLQIWRGTDQWYEANVLCVRLVSNGAAIASNEGLRAPDDVPINDWLRHTYWYEVVRNGQEITFRYSYDGTNYIDVFSTSLSTPVGATQKVIISANVWTTAGSYADWDYIYVEPSIIHVAIDIKPGSFPNSINLKSKGNVPVAILSDSTFDATTVDRSTVLFAGASPLSIGQSPEDVNSDGLLDVVLHFKTQDLNLQLGDTEACLSGKTLDGQAFEGCDSISIVK